MELFQKQLKEMNEDYEYSKRIKDESKKQLEARFADLERYHYQHLGRSRAAEITLRRRAKE